MKIAQRLKSVDEYVFSKLSQAKFEVEMKTGKKVLDLSIGSPDFPPSVKYLDKLAEYIKDKKSHLYPGYGAIPQFGEGVVSWYKKRFGVFLDIDSVIPLLGAKEGVSYLPMALVDEGAEVLVPDPGYPAFSGPAKLLGAKLVYYDANKDINISELEKKITKKTVCIWINSPSNPTGMVLDLEKLKQIVDLAIKKHVWVIYDNAYSEITFDGYVAPSILEVEGAEKVSVEIGSFSKSHSFAGYRMGWMVGNKNIIEAVKTVKSQFDSGMSRPLQLLGAYALNNPDDMWHKAMIESYEKRRQIILDNIRKIGLTTEKPKGGLYLWVKIPERFNDSYEYVFYLLEKRQILMAPGTAFGRNGKMYVRVSISSNIDSIDDYFV